MNLWMQLVYFIALLLSNLRFATATLQLHSDSPTVRLKAPSPVPAPPVILQHLGLKVSASIPNRTVEEQVAAKPVPAPVLPQGKEQTANGEPLRSVPALVPFPWGSDSAFKDDVEPKRLIRSVANDLSELKKDVAPAGDQVGDHGGNGDPKEPSRGSRGPTFGDGFEVLLFRVAANGLPGLDPFGGKSDPYFKVSYSNGTTPDDFAEISHTKKLTDTHEPIWNEIIKYEEYMRGGSQRLQFEIMDHDTYGWDDRIGYAWINVDECVAESRRQSRRVENKDKFSFCSAQISGDNGELFLILI